MQTKDLTLQNLTVDEFKTLMKVLIREAFEEVLQEMLVDDEANLELRPEFVQELLERQRLRREGKTKPVSAEEAMKVLSLEE